MCEPPFRSRSFVSGRLRAGPVVPKSRAATLKRQQAAERAMRGWKAWLIIAVIGFLGGLLLWFGLAIVVRAERASDRVDVTIQRRFLGFLPLSTETVRDVVNADVYIVWNRGGTGGRQSRGSTMALELTRRDGGVVRRTRFGPSFGTQPSDMAPLIAGFIKNSERPSPLTAWWMPWLVNLASLPFVLIAGGIVGEVALRKLGVLKPASAKETT
jgi:hypothetical protein